MKTPIKDRTDYKANHHGKERILAIFDKLPVFVAQFDRKECCRYYNGVDLDLFALDAGHIKGRPIKTMLGELAYQQLQPHISSVLCGSRVSAEITVDTPEPGKRYLMVHLIPEEPEKGMGYGFVTLMCDITGIKVDELNKSQNLLRTAHQSRIHTMGEMVAEIAHELNQPLAAIASYTVAGLRGYHKQQTGADELARILEKVNSEIQRVSRVIDHIRGFARNRSVQPEVTDVNHMIRDVLELLAGEFHWHGIGLTTNLQTSDMQVNVDRILIEQVFVNVIRNAIDALDFVERRYREIVIVSRRAGDNIVVEISNNGPALSKELLDRIFEPFFTTKPDGLGMGLPMSRSIVTSFSGKLWVVQNARDGITFTLQLPAWSL